MCPISNFGSGIGSAAIERSGTYILSKNCLKREAFYSPIQRNGLLHTNENARRYRRLSPRRAIATRANGERGLPAGKSRHPCRRDLRRRFRQDAPGSTSRKLALP